MNTPYLSVIVPAYNEEKRITATLLDMDRYLTLQDFSYEIIVVDDGSTDNTVGVVERLTDMIRNLRVIANSDNHGKGFVVRKGMLESAGQIRLFTDADNSTTLDHFDLMKPLFDAGEQVVICTRDKRDHPEARQEVSQDFLKRLRGDVGNIVIQIVAGLRGIWDTQCGFKAFTAEAAEKIFSQTTIDGWGFDVEALAIARHYLGYTINLVPANWVNDPRSHVAWSATFGILAQVFSVRWNMWRGRYRSNHHD